MDESPEKTEGNCEICQKSAKRRCSACKLVFYCSLEHQQSHWKTHKVACKPFEVSHSSLLGRYIKASRDLKYGDLIFTEKPLIFGPKINRIEEGPFPCVGCCKLLNDQTCERCPGCFWPVCKLDCEGLKLPNCHGFECNVLKLRPKSQAQSFYDYYRFDILIILRALYLQKYNSKKWKILVDLEGHSKYRGPNTNTYKLIEEKVQVLVEKYLNPLKEYEVENKQVIIPDASVNLIHKIYGILDVNAIELNEETDTLVLYHKASFLEHNCTPNTMLIIEENDGFKVTCRAAASMREEDHITSIYTHILWGTRARRDHLKKHKYFICTCPRCKDPTEFGTMLSGLKCMGSELESCGGIQLPLQPTEEYCMWQCNKCKIQLPDEEIMKFVNHLTVEVEKLLADKPTVKELEDLYDKLLVFLHPNHYLIYNVKHTLVQLYGIGNEKLKMCEDLIQITKKIDPGIARLSLYMGVLLNESFMLKFKFLIGIFEENRKNEFVGKINEISTVLEESKRILQYERHSQAGSKLLELICQNELKFNNWINQKGVKCG